MKPFFLTLFLLSNTLYADSNSESNTTTQYGTQNAALTQCGIDANQYMSLQLLPPNVTKCFCREMQKNDHNPHSQLNSYCTSYLKTQDNHDFEKAALGIDSAAFLACTIACVQPGNLVSTASCECLTFLDGVITTVIDAQTAAQEKTAETIGMTALDGVMALMGAPSCLLEGKKIAKDIANKNPRIMKYINDTFKGQWGVP
jgi:hypothetical protein